MRSRRCGLRDAVLLLAAVHRLSLEQVFKSCATRMQVLDRDIARALGGDKGVTVLDLAVLVAAERRSSTRIRDRRLASLLAYCLSSHIDGHPAHCLVVVSSAEESNQTLCAEAEGRVYPISPSLNSPPLVSYEPA